jgi:hypothetical protein
MGVVAGPAGNTFGTMGKQEALDALRKATLEASDTTSDSSSPMEVERADGLRDLHMRQAHAAGASLKEIEDATHLAPEQIAATLAKPGL